MSLSYDISLMLMTYLMSYVLYLIDFYILLSRAWSCDVRLMILIHWLARPPAVHVGSRRTDMLCDHPSSKLMTGLRGLQTFGCMVARWLLPGDQVKVRYVCELLEHASDSFNLTRASAILHRMTIFEKHYI